MRGNVGEKIDRKKNKKITSPTLDGKGIWCLIYLFFVEVEFIGNGQNSNPKGQYKWSNNKLVRVKLHAKLQSIKNYKPITCS